MNPNLKLLKTISDGWREEWKIRVSELATIKEGVRGAKERWKLAEQEYKEAKKQTLETRNNAPTKPEQFKP